jgi:uncharacterized membrane protein YidH (DUF202 family)
MATIDRSIPSARLGNETAVTSRTNRNVAQPSAIEEPGSEPSWWDLISSTKSLVLENKSSVARDHMANERTFLAWLRTSLSFVTIGVGVTQLFRLENKSTKVDINNSTVLLTDDKSGKGKAIDKYGKPLGLIFIILGILTLLMGFVRFYQVQHMLTKNYYPATRLSILSLIVLILVVVIITFVMVLNSSV